MASNTESTPSNDQRAEMDKLISSANYQYSLKHYLEASDRYSRAAELQEQVNGEMNAENADLLYRYGRCLYKVAVQKSDVLGGQVTGGGQQLKKSNKVKKETAGEGSSKGKGVIAEAIKEEEEKPSTKDDKFAEGALEAVVEEKDGKSEEPKQTAPFFQLEGMDDWDTEDEDEEDEGDAEQEEDDFATAFEILDIARVLLEKKLEALQKEKGDQNGIEMDGKGKEAAPQSMDEEIKTLKERLADTYDLQTEINFENEDFNSAVPDARASLTLKKETYPKSSNLVAEAHFKLSLALEFVSMNSLRVAEAARQAEEAGEAKPQGSSAEKEPPKVDEALREEAAVEMEAAIESTKLRIQEEEGKPEETKKQNAKLMQDVKEMMQEMKDRLTELRSPVSLEPAAPGPAGATDENPLNSILGAVLGESVADQKKRIGEATKTANDLSGLVRHKKKPVAEANAKAGAEANGSGSSKGKRKAGEVEDVADKEAVQDGDASAKKVRTEVKKE